MLYKVRMLFIFFAITESVSCRLRKACEELWRVVIRKSDKVTLANH